MTPRTTGLRGTISAAIVAAAVWMQPGPAVAATDSAGQPDMVRTSVQRPLAPGHRPEHAIAQSSWQVAQDISEKEAFDLARDVGTIRGWQAFLIKFPTGFRAELAKSYIQKLSATQPQTPPTGSNGDAGAGDTQQNQQTLPVDYVRAFELDGPYRLEARDMDKVYINNTTSGTVTVLPNALDRRSGHWHFEPVTGTPYVRIRNRWKNTYLYLNRSTVRAQRRSRNDRGAHWSLERSGDGSDHVVIRNRQSGAYLWTDRDDLVLFTASGEASRERGHWRFMSMDRGDNDDGYDDGDDVLTAPRITCIGGRVRNGSCRCSDSRKRVRLARNRYRCTTPRKKPRRECDGNSYRNAQGRCVSEGSGQKCGRGRTWVGGQGRCVCIDSKRRWNGSRCVRKSKQSTGSPRRKVRCSAVKFAYTRGNTCKCAGGRIFTGRACILPQ